MCIHRGLQFSLMYLNLGGVARLTGCFGILYMAQFFLAIFGGLV